MQKYPFPTSIGDALTMQEEREAKARVITVGSPLGMQ